MININKTVLTSQRKLFLLIVAAIAAVIAALWLVNKKASEPAVTENATLKTDIPPPEPDLTGAVSNTFDGQVQSNILTDAQLGQKKATDALTKIDGQLTRLTDKLSQMDHENENLKARLAEMQKSFEDAQKNQSEPGKSTGGAMNAPSRQTEYRMGPLPVRTGQIDSAVFSYEGVDKKKSKSSAFYIPSGTFSGGIVIEGADANASVRGESKLVPMQFKLTGEAHLPGNQKSDKIKDCFVTAAAYADISSERTLVQTQKLSCIHNGKHIDQAVKGHVAFYGKNGIKGIPVMRNGQVLLMAGIAGGLGGLGQSASQVGQTVTGIGATATVGAGDVARSAIGGGASTAAGKLADYYIERAEQYHPIIPIGAGNRVEIVFIEGFKAEYLEEKEEAKAQTAKGESDATASGDTVTADRGNTGLPPELIGRLGDAQALNVEDFVTPAKGGQ